MVAIQELQESVDSGSAWAENGGWSGGIEYQSSMR